MRSRWLKSERRDLNVGDLVRIADASVKNTFYQMAGVLEVQPGSGGIMGPAKIKTATGDYQRPLAKLALVIYQCTPTEKRAGKIGATTYIST